MQVWRICRREYLNSSYSGQGGLVSPGRWHRKGYRIVYTAQSLALAALEVWVHVAPQKPLPWYVAVPATIPAELPIQIFEDKDLPPEWRTFPLLDPRLQDIGERWIEQKASAAARVPSVVIPGEFNFLLNPLHADFARIQPGEPTPFEFDPRMWKKGKPLT